MFTANKHLLDKWNNAITWSNKMLRLGVDAVCEKHFAKDDIIKYYENKIPDGSIQKNWKGATC